MILTCPSCSTRYTVDEAKFPASGRTVRCAKCGHSWHQPGPEAEPVPAPEPDPVLAVPPEPVVAPAAAIDDAPFTPASATRAYAPAAQVPEVAPVGVADAVQAAAEATGQTVRVVAAASALLPEARVKLAVRVCVWVLVVLVVLAMVTLPVLLSATPPVAARLSLPRVGLLQPVAVVDRVAAPTPRVALPLADQ